MIHLRQSDEFWQIVETLPNGNRIKCVGILFTYLLLSIKYNGYIASKNVYRQLSILHKIHRLKIIYIILYK